VKGLIWTANQEREEPADAQQREFQPADREDHAAQEGEDPLERQGRRQALPVEVEMTCRAIV